MSKSNTPISGGNRGVSELVGVVLLFGIVIAGSALIFMSGSAVTEEVRAQGRVDAAESTFLEIDGSIQSLAQERGSDRDAIQLGSVDPDDAEIRDTGEMTITINENSACSATMDLSALEYQDHSGAAVIYEAGAVWKRTESGLVTKKSPELGYHNGSLQLEVVSLAGAVENDDMNIDYNRTESIEQTRDVQQELFSEDSCHRPKHITISVQSDYHEGWQTHLESSLPDSATVTSPGSETVTAAVSLDKDYPSVDLNNSDSIPQLPSGGNEIQIGPVSPLFNNGPSTTSTTTFDGSVTFLGGDNARFATETVAGEKTVKQEVTVEYSETVDVEMSGQATVTVENVEWYWDNETKMVEGEDQPPLEVAFVLDESGSMRGGKLDRAKSATRSFLDVMKTDQGHRVALIGYDTYYRTPDVDVYEEFTEDQSAVESSLEDLQAGGGTPIPHAIEETSDQFRADGTDDNKQIMVLVTDGKDRSPRDPVKTAREEIPDGVTVYTIGVGDDVNDDVLRDVASYGAEGSKYISVDNAGELDSVFERIAKDETKKEVEVPNKEKRVVTETKTVDVTEMGSDTITVDRDVEKSHPATEGDEVVVNGTATASDSFVVDEVEVERTIEYINETETETVTKDVEVTIDGDNTTEVEGEVTLGSDRTKTVEDDTTYDLVTRPTVSMSLDTGTTTVDLWSGHNLNAPARSVEPGAYHNFRVDDGSSLRFQPSFRLCSSPDREDETIEVGGTTYNETTCTDYESPTASSATVHVYNNTSTIDVAGSADFQTDLTEMLTVDGTQYYKTEGGDLKAWNLDDNQAIVVVEVTDSGGSDANNVVLLVEVGKPKSEVTGEHLVNVEVTSVVAENDEDDD